MKGTVTFIRRTITAVIVVAAVLTAYEATAIPVERRASEQIPTASAAVTTAKDTTSATKDGATNRETGIDPYTKLGILFGFGYIGCYLLVSALRYKSWPDLVPTVLLFVSGFGLAVGSKLIVVAFGTVQLGPFQGEDRYYIIIGGLVVIWASIHHLAVEITRRPPSLFR